MAFTFSKLFIARVASISSGFKILSDFNDLGPPVTPICLLMDHFFNRIFTFSGKIKKINWSEAYIFPKYTIELRIAHRLSVRRFQMPFEGWRFVKTLSTLGIIYATDQLLQNMTKIAHLLVCFSARIPRSAWNLGRARKSASWLEHSWEKNEYITLCEKNLPSITHLVILDVMQIKNFLSHSVRHHVCNWTFVVVRQNYEATVESNGLAHWQACKSRA